MNGSCFMQQNMVSKWQTPLSLEHWVDVYRGDLGVALSDTYTTDVFFQQFDKNLQNYSMA